MEADKIEPTRPTHSPPGAAVWGIKTLLAQHFAFEELRPFQREAIRALLPEGGRVLLVAPTGGGKSLCYQLPAIALPGTALVVSPLVALMDDQVRGLSERGISATYFASTLSADENGRRLAGLRRGQYKLVYAAPERLGNQNLLRALSEVGTSLVAIDEAHCIVQWGHDFRPDYLRIGEALTKLCPPRVIACTATATRGARDEIVRRLGWDPRKITTILRGFYRPNLSLAVERVRGLSGAVAAANRALSAALRGQGVGIVYAATRKGAEDIGAALRDHGWDAPVYHGGTSPEERARISAEFSARKTRVLVATNAFGMGVDRPDVRIVVHAQPPASIEAYYQEVGRAGRDGKPARGVLLVSRSDLVLRRRLCKRGPDGAPAPPKDAARALSRFSDLVRYIEATTCRQLVLLRHFGDKTEIPGGACGICDACLGDLSSTEKPAEGVKDEAPDTVRDPPRFAATNPPNEEPARPAREPSKTRRGEGPPPGVPIDVYEALCRYRAARASSLGVPAYVVATNRTLAEMALVRPETLDDLRRIYGMGPARIAAHGEGFCRAIRGLAGPLTGCGTRGPGA